MRSHSVLVFSLISTVANLGWAGDARLSPSPKAPKDAIQVAPEASRWSIGAGIVFREIEGGFSLKAPTPLSYSRAAAGRGDVGFFTGTTGSVRYDDGLVGPAYGYGEGDDADNYDGTAYGVINSRSQLSDSGRVGDGDETISNLRFHSSNSWNASAYKSQTFHSSDEELGVGPYVDVRYAAFLAQNLRVNIMMGYSWVGADLSSGQGLLATQSVSRLMDRYTYTYDHFGGNSGATDPDATFPFEDDGGYTIINSEYANGPDGYGSGTLPPRKSQTRSGRNVAQYYAVGYADLDVNLHEVVFAPEIAFDLGNRLHVGLSVGPTLNIIETDMKATAAWYQRGSSKPVRTYHASESGTDVKLGVASQLSVTFDLTQRLYIQASGSYRYVPSVDVEAGFARASVDTTAWQGAVGLGIRL